MAKTVRTVKTPKSQREQSPLDTRNHEEDSGDLKLNGRAIPRKFISIGNIPFPKFNPQQIEYFKKLIDWHRLERLKLEPREEDFDKFQLQWNSLLSKEEEYQYLIDTQEAIEDAEFYERIREDNPELADLYEREMRHSDPEDTDFPSEDHNDLPI